MLALRAHHAGADVVLEEVETPEPGPQDVLVKVAAAGLAPGMMTMLAWGAFKHLPTTLGHEIAGTVVSIGDDVDPTLVGSRVRVHPNLTCRACSYCLSDREQMCSEQAMIGHAGFGDGAMSLYERYHDGGLAAYVRVPGWLVDTLPDNVSFEVGAKVHDLANAARALRLAVQRPASSLLVTAATGTMGTATIKLAPHFGVDQLILVGRDAARLAAVSKLADVAVETIALNELPPSWETEAGLTAAVRRHFPHGVDAAIDYLPSGAGTSQAVAALAKGANLVHIGGNPAPLALPMGALLANCWRVIGSHSCTRSDATTVLELLASGALEVNELITHRFPLESVQDALTLMADRHEPMWMGVIHP